MIRKIVIGFILLNILLDMKAQVTDQIAPMNSKVTGDVSNGYIFITQSTLDSADTYPTALCVMDSIGNPIFFKAVTKQTSAPYVRTQASDFKIQPSGLFSYSTRLVSNKIGMYLMDNDFYIVDSIQCVDEILTDGHDFIHTPDGSYHLVGTEERTMDLSSLYTDNGIQGNVDAVVTGNVIQRFDVQKNLVFEWKSLDHFAVSDVYSFYFTDPSELDHSHYNSLEIDDDGNYILSFRHLHEITKVDALSGQIIWRLGGKNNQFTFLGDTMRYSAQHDARRIDNGNLTLFDNGTYNSSPVARAVEYQLDEVNMTATAVWQFHEPNGYNSQFIGNTNRLPNGNTLIDWGGAFPLTQTISFTEVDSESNVVMELDFVPNRYVSYRAVKHHLPFNIHRPQIICDGQNMTLSAPTGYEEYHWNTGALSKSIVITDTGAYQVWVNQGIGFLSSEKFVVSNLDSLCNATNIVEIVKPKLWIYPNPATSHLIVEYETNTDMEGSIINSSGQKVLDLVLISNFRNSSITIDISHLPSGNYLLQIGGSGKMFMKK